MCLAPEKLRDSPADPGGVSRSLEEEEEEEEGLDGGGMEDFTAELGRPTDAGLPRGDCTRALSLGRCETFGCFMDLKPPADRVFGEALFLCLSSAVVFGGGGFARVATLGKGGLCFLVFFTSPGVETVIPAPGTAPGDDPCGVFLFPVVCTVVLSALEEATLVGRPALIRLELAALEAAGAGAGAGPGPGAGPGDPTPDEAAVEETKCAGHDFVQKKDSLHPLYKDILT